MQTTSKGSCSSLAFPNTHTHTHTIASLTVFISGIPLWAKPASVSFGRGGGKGKGPAQPGQDADVADVADVQDGEGQGQMLADDTAGDDDQHTNQQHTDSDDASDDDDNDDLVDSDQHMEL